MRSSTSSTMDTWDWGRVRGNSRRSSTSFSQLPSLPQQMVYNSEVSKSGTYLHGILLVDLIDGYDLDDFVTFTRYADYDILDIHFGEMEGPDEWVAYELGSLIAMRDELMEGDLRALYIVWLASQRMMESYDEEEDYEISVP